MTGDSKQKIVTLVLDETGSMMHIKSTVISAVNEYITGLVNEDPDALFIFSRFNSARIMFDNVVPAGSVSPLTELSYCPQDTTPLYDAVGKAVANLDQILATYGDNVPAVLVVIMTDGEENASKEYTRRDIFELITERTGRGWTFLYLGANQDVWQVGAQIGVKPGNTLSYAPADFGKTMQRVSSATSEYMKSDGDSSKDYLIEK